MASRCCNSRRVTGHTEFGPPRVKLTGNSLTGEALPGDTGRMVGNSEAIQALTLTHSRLVGKVAHNTQTLRADSAGYRSCLVACTLLIASNDNPIQSMSRIRPGRRPSRKVTAWSHRRGRKLALGTGSGLSWKPIRQWQEAKSLASLRSFVTRAYPMLRKWRGRRTRELYELGGRIQSQVVDYKRYGGGGGSRTPVRKA